MEHLTTHRLSDPRVDVKESRVNGRVKITVNGPDGEYTDRSEFICADKDRLICKAERRGTDWNDHLTGLLQTGWWCEEEWKPPLEDPDEFRANMISRYAMILYLPRDRLLGEETQRVIDAVYDDMRRWLSEDAEGVISYQERDGCDYVEVRRSESFGIVSDWIIRERDDKVFIADLPVASDPLTPVRIDLRREGDSYRYIGSPTPGIGRIPYNLLSEINVTNLDMSWDKPAWSVLDTLTGTGAQLWLMEEYGDLDQWWGRALLGISAAEDIERDDMALDIEHEKRIPQELSDRSLRGAAAIFPVIGEILNIEPEPLPEDPVWDAWNRLHVWDKEPVIEDLRQFSIGVSDYGDVHELYITEGEDEIFGSSLTRGEVAGHVKNRTPMGLSIVDRGIKF
jgi:hypothetical protein